jgi:hypothetical protein
MTRDDIIRMAREAGFELNMWQLSVGCEATGTHEELERFAALIVAAEREKVARWMMERGYATGHGDSTEDLLQELDWQIAENWNRALINGITTEREACAKVCETKLGPTATDFYGKTYAAAIRARGQA